MNTGPGKKTFQVIFRASFENHMRSPRTQSDLMLAANMRGSLGVNSYVNSEQLHCREEFMCAAVPAWLMAAVNLTAAMAVVSLPSLIS